MVPTDPDRSRAADRDAREAWRDAERARLARARSALAAEDLVAAGDRVAEALAPLFADHRGDAPPVVAGYAAVRGELPVDAALARAREAGWITALPVTAGTTMRFVGFDANTPLRPGRFGIVVPDVDATLLEASTYAPVALTLVLVPLLGFDARLDRLGMGGGFYDRAFAHRAGDASGRPRLVGVAHASQRLDDVRAMPWDVPLDAVVTEHGLVMPSPARP